MSDVQEVVNAWKDYLVTIDNWETLVKGIEPKAGGCGLVYELSNPIERPNESFAIADMRKLELSEPHSHANGEVEIYFVLQGSGTIAVGQQIRNIRPGDSVVTPTETMHTVLPKGDLVLAVVNTPPFKVDNYVVSDLSDLIIAETIAKLTQ